MVGIIDADTHIIEHPGVWEGFDPAMYARRPVLASIDAADARGGRNFVWMIDGSAVPKRTGRGSVALAVGGSDSENTRSDISTGVRYLTDPAERVRDMDARGVWAEVVYPTLLLAWVTDDVALEVAICQAYNRFLGEAWRVAGDRLRWVVVPPLRDIAASVREIEWARDHGGAADTQPPERFEATRVPASSRLELDLTSGKISTIVWATGFRPDYSWLDVPVLDRKGRLRHDGGVVDAPGLYAIGLPVLRRRKSSFIHGAEDDARDVIEHLAGYLAG